MDFYGLLWTFPLTKAAPIAYADHAAGIPVAGIGVPNTDGAAAVIHFWRFFCAFIL